MYILSEIDFRFNLKSDKFLYEKPFNIKKNTKEKMKNMTQGIKNLSLIS